MESPPTLGLLSATERHAFNAFLSSVSLEAQEQDWRMYGLPVPEEASDPLSKATKDLISLHPAPHHRPIAPAPDVGTSNTQQHMHIHTNNAIHYQHHHQHQHQHQQQQQHQHQHQHHPTHPAYLPARPPPPKRQRTSPPPPPSPSIATPRTTLLSAQQKKANHIQSEQKRRANIRRGYEALCETVPALREAIRAEEEGSGSGSAGGRRRRARGEDEKEKADGRAGPRSESVVLQKTIEHIQGLLDEKTALMARLERARGVLGPGHPSLCADLYGLPAWERVWDGGKGLMGDEHGESDYE